MVDLFIQQTLNPGINLGNVDTARFAELMADKAALEAQMKRGAEEASYYARRTLSKFQKKLGFVQIR